MVIYGVRGDAGRDSDNFNTGSVLLRELTRESLNYFIMFRAKDSMTAKTVHLRFSASGKTRLRGE